MILRPTNLSLQDWADAVLIDLDRYGMTTRLVGDDWRNWGLQLLQCASAPSNLPDPMQFETWLEWAERLCGVME